VMPSNLYVQSWKRQEDVRSYGYEPLDSWRNIQIREWPSRTPR